MTRRRINLCAALYAEGTSDYEFLSPLIQRLLDVLGSRLFPGMVDVGETIGIDAPKPIPSKRAERIAAAVADHWNAFTLLIVHADGAGAPDEVRQNNILPGIELARSAFPSLIAVPCVPVREIEAWMLADDNVFTTILGREASVSLPADRPAKWIPNNCSSVFSRTVVCAAVIFERIVFLARKCVSRLCESSSHFNSSKRSFAQRSKPLPKRRIETTDPETTSSPS